MANEIQEFKLPIVLISNRRTRCRLSVDLYKSNWTGDTK